MAIPIPVADPTCPAPGDNSSIDVIGSIPVIGDVSKTASTIGSMASTFTGWITNPSQMAHDIGGWITFNLFGYNVDAPNCFRPTSSYGFMQSVLLGDVHIDASPVYHDGYAALTAAGFMLVFLAAMGRVAKLASGADVHPARVIADVLARVVLAVAAIQVGFATLAFVLPLASAVGASLLGQLLGIVGAGGTDPLGPLLYGGIGAIMGLGLFALILIPVLLIFLGRVLALLVARFLIVSMGVIFTPVIIALAVFDHRAAAVRWWWSMMLGAIITPVVVAAMLGATLALSLRFALNPADGFAAGPATGAIMSIGGLWLTGKAVRALLTHLPGQHGGAIASVRHAAETILAVPAAAMALSSGGVTAALSGISPTAGRMMAMALGGGGTGSAVAAVGARSADGGTSRAVAGAVSGFRSSPGGAALARAATPHMEAGTAPSARWAHLAGRADLSGPMQRLDGAVAAGAVRSGNAEPGAAERQAFVSAALASGDASGASS